MSVLIQYKSKRFTIDLSPFGNAWAQQVTLHDLIRECSSITDIPPQNIKLLTTGGTYQTKDSSGS